MKQIKPCLFVIFHFIFFGSSCSQPIPQDSSSDAIVFHASTPCDDASKRLLNIPPEAECGFIKWHLTFYQDSKTSMPTTFNLKYVYGSPKQGTKGFTEDAVTVELKGKCAISKGTKENSKAIVYKLVAESPGISLSFLQLDPNLLHLLNEDMSLMIGNSGWSYTLNRVDPVKVSSDKNLLLKNSTLSIVTDSPVVGIFGGRTPCNSALRALNSISADGCQIIKCQLTLYQDVKTHTPTTFTLFTVYVGKGDTKYTVTGKWRLTQNVKHDPAAIFYHLEPDTGKSKESLSFLKAGDNILFLLDKDSNFLVGDSYTSFTLNRIEK